LPPLRERREDIRYLVQKFIEEAGVELHQPVQGLGSAALTLLEAHPWPGNVRELRNVVRQCVLRTDDLVIRRETVEQFLMPQSSSPPRVAGASDKSLREVADEAAHRAERDAICDAL